MAASEKIQRPGVVECDGETALFDHGVGAATAGTVFKEHALRYHCETELM